ncbi:MAG: RNA polymerase sigma factor [Clostridia bacterium]|nr:RNA polymerase sigma factor [Clostridia bacterium]
MNNDQGAVFYKRFLEGDESAFEEILNTYREGLTFFICRYVKNVDVAEDIAADVFAYIIFKPKKYNFKVSLKTYLYTIGRSRALDWLRKESKRRHIPIESLYNEPSDNSKTLEETVIAEEEKRKLYAAMDKLPDDYKTAMHLVYFEGLSYEEAAKVMDKNKKQIENIIYRAKKTLRKYLEES